MELKVGPVSPQRKRQLELEKQLIATSEQSAAATKAVEEATLALNSEESRSGMGVDNAEQIAAAELALELAKERKQSIIEITAEQDKLNQKLAEQYGL